ncbi:hypothetical protein ABZ234_31935 [Nocardiopsis sp. NPDC006198]|uniref:hypothetical protein n=1 Tax=Nocardiopsis sp. NPDC006198 TaxID=3154472 RepID=UPI0033B3BB4F
MAETRLQVPVSEDLEHWLAERSRRTSAAAPAVRQARIELDLWRSVLAAELRRIRLSAAQAVFLGRLMGPVPLDGAVAAAAPVVYTRAADVLLLPWADAAPSEHAFDAEALLGYLHRLGPAADHALHQACADWYAAGADPSPAAWARVGLTVREGALTGTSSTTHESNASAEHPCSDLA